MKENSAHQKHIFKITFGKLSKTIASLNFGFFMLKHIWPKKPFMTFQNVFRICRQSSFAKSGSELDEKP